jgi:ribosomal protein S12 methylthiotransferase accessory factor
MDMLVSFPGGQKVNAGYKGFTIRTDQPSTSGGEGSAPSPFDLFIASLGTCAGFYLLRFCQERGIAMDGIQVSLSTSRNPETRMIERMDIDVELPADFPDKYVKAVVGAANQCTVKKHLADPPEIRVNSRKKS